jgi:hypothetical protein
MVIPDISLVEGQLFSSRKILDVDADDVHIGDVVIAAGDATAFAVRLRWLPGLPKM